jgi:lipid A 3-O-deacylase
MGKVFFKSLVLLLPLLGLAQKIDNMASFRDIRGDRYFRFNYDNDYFASRDENYTQGYSFELVSPAMRKNPLHILLLKPLGQNIKFGVAIEHIGFSPNNIKSELIQYGDRPFAAAIMLKSFAIATDTIRHSRFIASLSTGLIGPGAFGKEMQVGIHQATGNAIPQGWQHQIRNDIVLNYELSYEKRLLSWRYFALQSNTTLRFGTLFTNAAIGFNGVVGLINTPLAPFQNGKGFRLYAYSQPLVSVVGYDATLQGGLFNRKSPYTINSGDIERFTAQHNYGFILQTKTLYFEYARTAITREFRSGHAAKWGGIKIGFRF